MFDKPASKIGLTQKIVSLNDFPKAQVNEAQGKVFEARITDENRINAVTLNLLVTKDESFLTAAVQFFESVDNSNTVIESKGTATLAKDEDSTYLIIDGEKELQLKNRQGKNYSDNTTPNWDVIAVELGSADSYCVLLQGQNTRSGQAYVWTTNSEGVITRGSGWKSGNALSSIEEEFNIDLNNDQLIGSSSTII